MKKLLVYLLLSTTLSVVFFSCKKYEDGPMISFIPKTKRLAGDWKVEKVLYTPSGGSEIDQSSTYEGSKWNIKEDETGSRNFTGYPNQPFTWAWDDKKEHITIFYDAGGSEVYEILKLKNDELWLKYESSGNVTEYHLAQ